MISGSLYGVTVGYTLAVNVRGVCWIAVLCAISFFSSLPLRTYICPLKHSHHPLGPPALGTIPAHSLSCGIACDTHTKIDVPLLLSTLSSQSPQPRPPSPFHISTPTRTSHSPYISYIFTGNIISDSMTTDVDGGLRLLSTPHDFTSCITM